MRAFRSGRPGRCYPDFAGKQVASRLSSTPQRRDFADHADKQPPRQTALGKQQPDSAQACLINASLVFISRRCDLTLALSLDKERDINVSLVFIGRCCRLVITALTAPVLPASHLLRGYLYKPEFATLTRPTGTRLAPYAPRCKGCGPFMEIQDKTKRTLNLEIG